MTNSNGVLINWLRSLRIKEMARIKWLIVIIFFVVVAVVTSYFFQNNNAQVQLKLILPFLGFARQTAPISLAWLSVSAFVIGFLVASGILLSQLLQQWFQIRRLKRENSALQRLIDRHNATFTEEAAHSNSSNE